MDFSTGPDLPVGGVLEGGLGRSRDGGDPARAQCGALTRGGEGAGR